MNDSMINISILLLIQSLLQIMIQKKKVSQWICEIQGHIMWTMQQNQNSECILIITYAACPAQIKSVERLAL
jgi:hypothetical protein